MLKLDHCLNYPVRLNNPVYVIFITVSLRYPKNKTKPLFLFQSPQRTAFKTLGGENPPPGIDISLLSKRWIYILIVNLTHVASLMTLFKNLGKGKTIYTDRDSTRSICILIIKLPRVENIVL